MTASESLKLYQLFFQLTKNETEARSFVSEFEYTINNTIDTKFEKEEKRFVPKNEFEKIDHKLDLMSKEFEIIRSETKFSISDLKAEIKSDLNKHLIWTFGLLITIATLAMGIAKLIF